MLKGKTVLLGVTGSIAAYKIAYLASALKKLHAEVHVLMTKNATNSRIRKYSRRMLKHRIQIPVRKRKRIRQKTQTRRQLCRIFMKLRT